MNYLFGKFNWSSLKHKSIVQDCSRFNNGSIDLHVQRTSHFNFDTKALFYNPTSNILCAMIGYISNLEKIKLKYNVNKEKDVEIIEKLYSIKKFEFILDLDGIFSIFIFDENIQKGYIFQDQYGSNLPIYYAYSKTDFVFSTTLKYLLKNTSVERELNVTAVHDFLYWQFIIPNQSTLIKNVVKLVPTKYIVIDNTAHSIKVKTLNRKEHGVPKSVAASELINTINNNIAELFNQLKQKNIALALSSGFDSNLILHILRKLTKTRLKVLTVGGKVNNEIPQTKSILMNYNNISHITSIIGKDTINSFPDIVWRTEGYTFSPALFLQYELAKILNEEKSTSIFLGECADQQLDSFSRNSKIGISITKIKEFVKRSLIGDLYYVLVRKELASSSKTARLLNHFRRYSLKIDYDIYHDLILKKNGIMLHSFGIQGLYPFLNKDTKTMAKALGKLNFRKRFYKQKVKEAVGPKVARYITKQLGTTDVGYLFSSRQSLIMKVLKSKFMNRILSKSQIYEITKNPTYHRALILQLLYLYLFNELFISGNYDSQFDNDKLDIPLSSFL